MANTLGWLDTLLITAGIIALIARQFFWRAADPSRLLRLPLFIIGIGVAWAFWEVVNGEPLTLFALAIATTEAVLVFATGSVMGLMARLRERDGAFSYRLASSWGILLWGVFLAIRIGSFVLAGKVGAHLLDTTGMVMVSFGTNRLASSMIVKHRIEHGSSK